MRNIKMNFEKKRGGREKHRLFLSRKFRKKSVLPK